MTFIINYTNFLFNRVLRRLLLSCWAEKKLWWLELWAICQESDRKELLYSVFTIQHLKWCGRVVRTNYSLHTTALCFQLQDQLCHHPSCPALMVQSLLLCYQTGIRFLVLFFLAAVSRFLSDTQALPNNTWRLKISRWCCCHSTKIFVLQAHNTS